MRIPVEVWPPGLFIQEELDARGWSHDDLHAKLGPDPIDHLAVDIVLAVHDKNLIVDEQTAAALGRAFDVSPEFFLNLDRAWRSATIQ